MKNKEKQIEEMASDLNDCITEFVTDTGDVYIDDEATATDDAYCSYGERRKAKAIIERFKEIMKGGEE